LGAQEQRYETDFFLQRQTMHVALPQCMLGMFLLVHDKAARRSRHHGVASAKGEVGG